MTGCLACFEEITEKRKNDRTFSAGEHLRKHDEALKKDNEPKVDFEKRLETARYERAIRLQEWEKECASAHSAKPVENSELLRRALRQDYDVHDGELVPPAFSDIKDLGMSVDRTHLTEVADSRDRTSASFKLHGHIPAGYVEISADFLRTLKIRYTKLDKECRSLGIFDTALPDNPSHADVFVIAHLSNKQPYSDLKSSLWAHCKDKVQAWPVEEKSTEQDLSQSAT